MRALGSQSEAFERDVERTRHRVNSRWGHHHFLHDFPHFTGSCAFWRRGREKTETPRNTLEMAAWESVREHEQHIWTGHSRGLADTN